MRQQWTYFSGEEKASFVKIDQTKTLLRYSFVKDFQPLIIVSRFFISFHIHLSPPLMQETWCGSERVVVRSLRIRRVNL